ncbi:hypothetical protein RM844_27695 [Streptomyces sp. DSM 44915]|uniref:Uncharacterized protein n=1 Tax=Streptomyces chisholmiae TaxID=3075540 RepID=A0ABU2JZA0_9ACTN|nr:hypothetical protein [Streptomyces sp. DSM 44915]MDT0270069.1 hypothetical protein [Streptomyces sp. DSM 44915]
MRGTDPLEFLSRHREIIFRILGIVAVLLVIFLIIRAIAMRMGGWSAAFARVRRELAITAHAFASPVRAWLRYRRSLRVLVHGLRAPATWRDAERALAAARQAAGPDGPRPYAALVDGGTVTVLLAGDGVGPPDIDPWWVADDDAPDHWSIDRGDLPPVVPLPDQEPPVLVAIGELGGWCAFLDVAVGPPLVCVDGERRGATALHQSVAAQLDVRLPEGTVVVAEGVHRAFDGAPIRTAYRSAARLGPAAGLAPFLVSAELPAPVPPELVAPPAPFPPLRVLLLGEGRGYARTLLSDRTGQVGVVGTPLVVEGTALSRAIARVLASIPPVLPPDPAGDANPSARIFAERDDEGLEEDSEAVPAAPPVALAPGPPIPEREDEAEEEAVAAPVADEDETQVAVPSARPRQP